MAFSNMFPAESLKALLNSYIQDHYLEFCPQPPPPSIIEAVENLNLFPLLLLLLWIVLSFVLITAFILALVSGDLATDNRNTKKSFEQGRRLGQEEGRKEALNEASLKKMGNQGEGGETEETNGDGEKWVKV